MRAEVEPQRLASSCTAEVSDSVYAGVMSVCMCVCVCVFVCLNTMVYAHLDASAATFLAPEVCQKAAEWDSSPEWREPPQASL